MLLAYISQEFQSGAELPKGRSSSQTVSLPPVQLTELVGRGRGGQKKKRKGQAVGRGLTCDAYITGHVTRVSQWEAAPAGTMQQVHRASSSLSVTTKTSVHPGTAV